MAEESPLPEALVYPKQKRRRGSRGEVFVVVPLLKSTDVVSVEELVALGADSAATAGPRLASRRRKRPSTPPPLPLVVVDVAVEEEKKEAEKSEEEASPPPPLPPPSFIQRLFGFLVSPVIPARASIAAPPPRRRRSIAVAVSAPTAAVLALPPAPRRPPSTGQHDCGRFPARAVVEPCATQPVWTPWEQQHCQLGRCQALCVENKRQCRNAASVELSVGPSVRITAQIVNQLVPLHRAVLAGERSVVALCPVHEEVAKNALAVRAQRLALSLGQNIVGKLGQALTGLPSIPCSDIGQMNVMLNTAYNTTYGAPDTLVSKGIAAATIRVASELVLRGCRHVSSSVLLPAARSVGAQVSQHVINPLVRDVTELTAPLAEYLSDG